MEIKSAKVLDSKPKSKQQIEREITEKHEEVQQKVDEQEEVNDEKEEKPDEKNGQEEVLETSKDETQTEKPDESNELDDNRVLDYFKKKYNKEVSSIDDLIKEPEPVEAKEPEYPEDISKYLQFKKETGRGMDDFVKLQQDFDKMDENSLLQEYYKSKHEGLDADDISYKMKRDFGYDEDDDEDAIREAKINKKQAINEAKKFFNSQKEKYKAPLESSGTKANLPEGYQEKIQAYQNMVDKSKQEQQELERRRNVFQQKTQEVFSDNFKGFEFKVGDDNVTYKPGSPDELLKTNSSITNFISKYMGDDGVIKDAKGFHKALSIANNPDKFAEYMFKQGVNSATSNASKSLKNVDMTENPAPNRTTSKPKARIIENETTKQTGTLKLKNY